MEPDQTQEPVTTTGADPGNSSSSNSGTSGREARLFSQSEVDRIIRDRLDRQARTLAAQAERERGNAEVTIAQERQQLIDELEQNRSEVIQLKATADRVRRYEEALAAYANSLKENVPQHVLTLVNRLDLADQLEYLTANREVVSTGNATPRVAPDINAAGGRSSAVQDPKQREQEIRQRYRLNK
jgi:hypothetical protein